MIVSRDGESEPREQVGVPDGTPFWGRDVDALRPGRSVDMREHAPEGADLTTWRY